VWDFNPWRTRPASCRIRDSAERDVALTWRSISPAELEPLRTAAVFGVTPEEFRITTPRAEVAWITVPSFAENVGDNRAGLEQLVRELPKARGARLIVFDVRGNHGGNSYWGRRLLESLFDADYVASIANRLSASQFIQWRTSSANADFIERSSMPRYDKSSAQYRELDWACSGSR
jgi:C-terminal processing protease CtpA/Prc